VIETRLLTPEQERLRGELRQALGELDEAIAAVGDKKPDDARAKLDDFIATVQSAPLQAQLTADQRDQLVDFLGPAGPIALREEAGAEPPVVVLARPLAVVGAHLVVHDPPRHRRHDSPQSEHAGAAAAVRWRGPCSSS
jgi:hypothetical protein